MAIETRRFPSSSSSTIYTAQIDTESLETSCDCPGWRFKKVVAERACKHTKLLLKELGGEPEVMTRVVPESKAATEATNGPEFKPMLASAMKEDQTLATFAGAGWLMEEKYDGHRMLVVVGGGEVQAWSRPGVNHPALQRALPPKLTGWLLLLPDGTYDGELYVEGGTSSDVGKLERKGEQRLALFDVLKVRGETITEQAFADRRAVLELAVEHAKGSDVLHATEIGPVDPTRIRAIMDRGGEGVIIKRAGAKYVSGWRSPDWVKVKRQEAAIVTITGWEEAKRGPYSLAVCELDNGLVTTVGCPDNATMREVEKNPDSYIGRKLVVSHNGVTSGGKYRHACWDHLL